MITVDKNKCPQNHACPSVNVCPVGAITQEGFGLPMINQETCIQCQKCINFCPRRAIQNVS